MQLRTGGSQCVEYWCRMLRCHIIGYDCSIGKYVSLNTGYDDMKFTGQDTYDAARAANRLPCIYYRYCIYHA